MLLSFLLISDKNKAIIVYDNTHLRTVLHLRWYTGEGVRDDDDDDDGPCSPRNCTSFINKNIPFTLPLQHYQQRVTNAIQTKNLKIYTTGYNLIFVNSASSLTMKITHLRTLTLSTES